MLNYVDRGAIASNGVNGSLAICTDSGICRGGSGIQGFFNLNNFQDGVLSSAFMVGLLIASQYLLLLLLPIIWKMVDGGLILCWM
ncbi:hypothetical protein AAZX31_01G018800 [Glycine max]|nr:hypothetical protein JHK86_000173 [Glycine max]